MTSTIGPRAGDDVPPTSTSPMAIKPSIPTRRSSFSTPLEAVRRRQEALERLAARRIVTTPPTRPTADHAHLRPMVSASVGSGMHSAPAPGGGEPMHPRVPLTSREVEVLRTWLLTDSKSVAASRLVISVGTVNTHLARIRTKYADAGRPARTKASLVARAIQDGLISLDEL
ncbi:response regulator transcription factor [Gordonia sputi]|uniref:response regulator transcription factor n=1 Tax=Gordonia sputi TaxID=36823 RepID=UPI00369BBB67